jgi:hypothetical protein
MLETLPHDQFIRLTITMWAIWGARRKAIHEDMFQSPLSTYGFIHSFLREISGLQKPKVHKQVASIGARFIPPWLPTQAESRCGSFKIFKKKGVATVFCKDHNGHYLGSSALVLPGITDNATLEAIASRESLAFAEDLFLTRIFVAFDCNVVVAN